MRPYYGGMTEPGTTDPQASRRTFLKTSLTAAAAMATPWPTCAQDTPDQDDATQGAPEPRFTADVPVTQLTQGPEFHWFGYYDKANYSPDNSLVLTNQVDFEHRSPTADDTIRVGYVPTDGSGAFTELGTSNAWGWQQGCMLQWVPSQGRTVIWNDREGEGEDARFVSHIRNLDDPSQDRTLPMPVYCVSPDGTFAVTTDFARIQNMRPGYGYPGVEDPYADQKAPDESGIHYVDLKTGETRLIITYNEIASSKHKGFSLMKKWHYFNHLLISPDGERFAFLHRWRKKPSRIDGQAVENAGSFSTRMITADCHSGLGRFVIDGSGKTSHFIWRESEMIVAWTEHQGQMGFYGIAEGTRDVRPIPKRLMPANGHNTFVPGTRNDWVLCDTYPDKQTRMQTVYLVHLPSERRIDLGQFYSPPEYTGEWRCDTHPRCSRDGRLVTIDSPHNGGRQVYQLDISGVLF